MDFFKVVTTTTVLLSLSQAASFQKLHDICDTTATQSCPNKSNEIKLLQKFLNIGADKKIAVSGKWDSNTKLAVINFQKEHKIPATGYVGAMTKTILDKELQAKLSKSKAKKTTTKIAKTTKVTKKVVKVAKTTKKVTKTIKIAKTKASKKEITKVKKAAIKLAKAKVATKKVAKKVDIKKISTYEAFRRSVNLRKSFAVYKDPKLLKVAGKAKTILKVDVSEQRVKLVVNGKVALSAPCTTGAKHKLEPNTRTYRDKHTPLGTFRILEKIATKRSTIFGNIYRNGKLIYHGDRRKYRGSWSGVKFVGAPLYKWMRLTSGGIGLHASSHVHRNPGSNGCVRLPKSVANTLFSKLKKGTIVKVVN